MTETHPHPADDPRAARDIVPPIQAIIERTVATVTADPVFGRIWDGTASRELYLRFLTQTYHYVAYTKSQLQAGGRALKGATDPLHVALRERFLHHEAEETGHDQWVLDDIRAIGGDPEAAKRAEPGPAVKAYVAMGIFLGQSRSPLGLLGIGAVLEGLSEQIASSAAANLKRRSGIPDIEKGVSFLGSHGDADVGHMEEAWRTLRAIRDADDQEAILFAAQATSIYYTHLLHP